MSKRIFISKNASEIEPFRSQIEELSFTVIAHSFLSFSPVEFDVQRDYDVIFFSSVRSVIFFKANQSVPEHKLIACIGEKTAHLLQTLGYSVDFKGTQSGSPKMVANEFKSWLGTKRALFPISDRSLKSISSEIPAEQKQEIIVYSTVVVGQDVPKCDVYVFTSPTNVEGFLIKNAPPQDSIVIAWGKSTESALISQNVPVDFCLKNASFEELMDYLAQRDA